MEKYRYCLLYTSPENGYSQYTIYTSMDGRDFDKLAEKTSKDSCDAEKGEVYQAEGKEDVYKRQGIDPDEMQMNMRIHKAISIIQFKVEGQIIRRQKAFHLENR